MLLLQQAPIRWLALMLGTQMLLTPHLQTLGERAGQTGGRFCYKPHPNEDLQNSRGQHTLYSPAIILMIFYLEGIQRILPAKELGFS